MHHSQVTPGPMLKRKTRQLSFAITISVVSSLLVHNRKFAVACYIDSIYKKRSMLSGNVPLEIYIVIFFLVEQYCTDLNYLNIARLAKAAPVLTRGTLV